MNVRWLAIPSPLSYVLRILAKEAPDVPVDSITRYDWYVDSLLLRELCVAQDVLERHDREPVHIARRDRAEARMTAGEAIPPLIALGARLALVDGYSRYRALKRLGVQHAQVLRQRVTPPPPVG